MSAFLPLFPLQLVVFPEEKINLHIFEPRYKQLINECAKDGITFGIPAFIDGRIMDVGTEIKLEKIEKRYPDGEMDIRSRGIGLFRIIKFFPKAKDRLYAGAEIERLPFETTEEQMTNEKILECLRELFGLLHIDKDLPADAGNFRTYDLAHQMGLSLEQEYELLSIRESTRRQDFILSHLRQLLPIVRETEDIRRKAQMNGHFQHLIPPKF